MSSLIPTPLTAPQAFPPPTDPGLNPPPYRQRPNSTARISRSAQAWPSFTLRLHASSYATTPSNDTISCPRDGAMPMKTQALEPKERDMKRYYSKVLCLSLSFFLCLLSCPTSFDSSLARRAPTTTTTTTTNVSGTTTTAKRIPATTTTSFSDSHSN